MWLNDFSQLSLSSCSSTLKQLNFLGFRVCVCVHRLGKAALFSLTWLLKLWCGSSAALLLKRCTLKTCVTCSCNFLFHHTFYHWLQTLLLAIFFLKAAWQVKVTCPFFRWRSLDFCRALNWLTQIKNVFQWHCTVMCNVSPFTNNANNTNLTCRMFVLLNLNCLLLLYEKLPMSNSLSNLEKETR